MPKLDGLSLLRSLKEADRLLDTIVMTAHGSVETAVEALIVAAGEDDAGSSVRAVRTRAASMMPSTVRPAATCRSWM